MKRALQANINNKVFYIDEDAYNLLQNYLNQLGDAFSGPEGQEIVGDIECRASELLSEKAENGKSVIDIQCIYNVIDTIGSPEELGEMAGKRQPADSEDTPPPFQEPKQRKKLYRDPNNKVLGGVVGGLAKYLGWDAGVMRVLLVILALTTYVMPMVICYLIAWMVIPLANTPRKRLEMEGREVTFDSVAQSLRDSAQEQLRKIDTRNVGEAATSLLGAIFKVCAGIVILGSTAIAFACIIGVFMSIFLPYTDTSWIHSQKIITYLPTICIWIGTFCLGLAIIMGAVAWCIGAAAFSWKGMSKATMIVTGVILALLIAVFIVASIYLAHAHISPLSPFRMM